MKRLSFAIILIFLMVNFGVFASGEPTITVSEAEANAGETVDVTISLSDNPGVISMLLEVEYDKEVMTLKDVKDAGLLGSTMHSDNLSIDPYFLFWSNGTAKSDFMVNGTVVTLTFEVSKNAITGVYPIKVNYDKQRDDIFNFNLENVDFNIVNGSVSVNGQVNAGQSSGSSGSGGGGSSSSKPKENKPDVSDGDKPVTTNTPKDVAVTVNGRILIFADQKPVIVDDRTLVPLRAIFETLGAEVNWEDEIKTVTAVRGDITVSLAIGSDKLYVNGEEKVIDVPAQIINSRTMVPIRAIAESFGCNVNWDDETKTVTISD